MLQKQSHAMMEYNSFTVHQTSWSVMRSQPILPCPLTCSIVSVLATVNLASYMHLKDLRYFVFQVQFRLKQVVSAPVETREVC